MGLCGPGGNELGHDSSEDDDLSILFTPVITFARVRTFFTGSYWHPLCHCKIVRNAFVTAKKLVSTAYLQYLKDLPFPKKITCSYATQLS